MVSEKRLIPCGEKCTLDELPCGTLFAFGDDCIAVKSEYRCDNGLIEAFIIDSGEQFWGGAHTAKEQNALMVQPLEIEEVVRCKDCKHFGGHGTCFCHAADENGTPIFVREDDFCSYGERKDNA